MNPGMIAAIAAVLVDSVVTLAVGWKLTHTARTEIAKGVEDVMEHAPEILAKAFMGEREDDGASDA
jgi:hypothetical protein